MNLVALDLDTIPYGQPLPFILRGADGKLLANKGFVVRDREELYTLLGRGVRLFVDTDESGESHRAYMAQVQRMLMSPQASLGQLAAMKMSASAAAQVLGGPQTNAAAEFDAPPDWPELQLRATQLLRSPSASDFAPRLLLLHEELAYRSRRAPDATLAALIYLSGEETHMYSATHAMLVACVCMLVAHETLRWPQVRVRLLGQAALSMNIGMTALQDRLAVQTDPLTTAQMEAVQSHAERSEALLRSLGIADAAWLEAVRHHHDRAPGALASRSEGQQMARLIQRADVFGARIAPRATRQPMATTAAMQAGYYDEDRQVDEAGAALIKTLGIYPPGTYVRLASQEVAVVLRRGLSATTPRVAVVLNRGGMPTGELITRDTAVATWKITGAVPRREVRVQLSLHRLLSVI